MKPAKYLIIVALMMIAAMNATAQTPQLINYQAVARDATGSILASTAISVRLDVHDGSATGALQYQETQSVTTNTFGLFTLQIGNGTAVVGSFPGITWGSGNKYLQVEIDPTGGSSYVDMGTQQLVSVPYALFAENANSATTITGGVTLGGDVTGTTAANSISKLQGNTVAAASPASGQVLKWNGAAWIPANDSVNTYSAGTGLTLTGATFSMPNIGTAGTYGSATQIPVLTTDAQGRVTAVTNTTFTAGTVTTVNTTPGQLTGGPITSSGTLGLATVGAASTYGSSSLIPVITTDVYGRVTTITTAPVTASSVTMGGDVTGVSTTSSVIKLQGRNISSSAPAAGQVLEWNSSSGLWEPTTPSGTTYTSGSGINIVGSVINAYYDSALWNADAIQGNSIMPTAPTSGQVLAWDASIPAWKPTTVSAGTGTVTSITAGAGLAGGTITTSGSIYMPFTGTAGTYGSATQVPVFTTDAQGRVTLVTNTTITGTVPAGTTTGDMLYWNGSAWVRVPVGTNGQVLQLSGSVPTWVGTTHNIGDTYGGGKVAYILVPGDPGYDPLVQHGLIAATSDQSTGIQWYNGSYTTTNAIGQSIGTGSTNTTCIVTNQGSGSYAALLCRQYAGGGYTDWYLPSLSELNELYINRVAIGGFASALYWSSFEYGATGAWVQSFASGVQGSDFKVYTGYVRAVRAF